MIKPCPFCGSALIDEGYIPVICYNCGAKGPDEYANESVRYSNTTVTWNDRKFQPLTKEQIMKLRNEWALNEYAIELIDKAICYIRGENNED